MGAGAARGTRDCPASQARAEKTSSERFSFWRRVIGPCSALFCVLFQTVATGKKYLLHFALQLAIDFARPHHVLRRQVREMNTNTGGHAVSTSVGFRICVSTFKHTTLVGKAGPACKYSCR